MTAKSELLWVKLADGRELSCPDVCIGREELERTDELWRTHGFMSLTVLRGGKALGWVPCLGVDLPISQVKP